MSIYILQRNKKYKISWTFAKVMRFLSSDNEKSWTKNPKRPHASIFEAFKCSFMVCESTRVQYSEQTRRSTWLFFKRTHILHSITKTLMKCLVHVNVDAVILSAAREHVRVLSILILACAMFLMTRDGYATALWHQLSLLPPESV